jgi:hypothetical protein
VNKTGKFCQSSQKMNCGMDEFEKKKKIQNLEQYDDINPDGTCRS